MVDKGTIRYYGKMFDTKGDVVPRAVQNATTQTKPYALEVLRRNTPVDTGFLKSSWDVMETKQGFLISNKAPYAIYQEMGTRYIEPRAMLKKSLPSIVDRFKVNLARELGKSLAAKAIEASPELSFEDYNNDSNFSNGLSTRKKRKR